MTTVAIWPVVVEFGTSFIQFNFNSVLFVNKIQITKNSITLKYKQT